MISREKPILSLSIYIIGMQAVYMKTDTKYIRRRKTASNIICIPCSTVTELHK